MSRRKTGTFVGGKGLINKYYLCALDTSEPKYWLNHPVYVPICEVYADESIDFSEDKALNAYKCENESEENKSG